MDDRERGWPFWKFGLKQDDLSNTLHDQYNTVPSSIQDPEAFHHDVCELSLEARNLDELHRLLADRKQQRLRELNKALESASITLSADAALIGAEQWEHATQLFRTRSLDSLVRFFASYLAASSDATSSCSQSLASARNSCAFSCPDDSAPSMTDEPLEFFDDFGDFHDIPHADSACVRDPAPLPPSPSSMPPCPFSSTGYLVDDDAYAHKPADRSDHAHDYFSRHAYTPSVTNSELEPFLLLESRLGLGGDDESQSSVPGTPCTSVSNVSSSAYDELAKAVILPLAKNEGHDEDDGGGGNDEPPQERLVVDWGPGDSPTPKADRRISGLFCSQTWSRSRRQRACSASSDRALTPDRARGDPREAARLPARRWGPGWGPRAESRAGQRCSEWPVFRVQKPASTLVRSRPGGRRRSEMAQLSSVR